MFNQPRISTSSGGSVKSSTSLGMVIMVKIETLRGQIWSSLRWETFRLPGTCTRNGSLPGIDFPLALHRLWLKFVERIEQVKLRAIDDGPGSNVCRIWQQKTEAVG